MVDAVLDTVHVRDHDLAVRSWGNPDATWQAVLVHGYGEHSGRYEYVAERLCDAGATVLAMDHRGHGKSDGERVLIEDFEDIVSDVVAVIEAHRAADYPLVIIGHSMGGMIAARLAQRGDLGDDLTALVLSGPVLGSWAAATDMLELDEIPDVPLDPAVLSRDPAVGQAYADDDLVWHGPFKRQTLEALAEALEVINNGGPLSVTTLWIHGAEDQLVPIEPSREGIEAIRPDVFSQRAYEGARHEVFNETNKDEVLGHVVDFIDRSLAENAEQEQADDAEAGDDADQASDS